MAYDIIVRFPNKELADEFCGQMSDGFGEGFCDFSPFSWDPDVEIHGQPIPQRLVEPSIPTRPRPVFFVNEIFDL